MQDLAPLTLPELYALYTEKLENKTADAAQLEQGQNWLVGKEVKTLLIDDKEGTCTITLTPTDPKTKPKTLKFTTIWLDVIVPMLAQLGHSELQQTDAELVQIDNEIKARILAESQPQP